MPVFDIAEQKIMEEKKLVIGQGTDQRMIQIETNEQNRKTEKKTKMN